jgi:hypothetical protein
MRTITAVIGALGIFGVVASAGPARADDDNFDGGWRRHEWHEHQWREHEWGEHAWHGYAPPMAYVAPGYYAVQPSYYPPPPVYYVPASPSPPPVYAAPGFSIGFSFR